MARNPYKYYIDPVLWTDPNEIPNFANERDIILRTLFGTINYSKRVTMNNKGYMVYKELKTGIVYMAEQKSTNSAVWMLK